MDCESIKPVLVGNKQFQLSYWTFSKQKVSQEPNRATYQKVCLESLSLVTRRPAADGNLPRTVTKHSEMILTRIKQ